MWVLWLILVSQILSKWYCKLMNLYKTEEKRKKYPPQFLTYLAPCAGILPGDKGKIRMFGFQCSRYRQSQGMSNCGSQPKQKALTTAFGTVNHRSYLVMKQIQGWAWRPRCSKAACCEGRIRKKCLYLFHSRQCHSQKLGSAGSKPHRVLLPLLCAALNIKGRESVIGESCVCVFSFISAA